MRKRGRQKRLFGRMSIVYIVMIITLSSIGVGYAAWSDGLNIIATMKTGNIFPQMNPNSLEYSGLDCTLSEDNTVLTISGEVYPGFNKEITVEVQDYGNIPTLLNSVDKLSTAEIVNLGWNSGNKNNRRSLSGQDANVVETFKISINADQNDTCNYESDSTTDEIARIEEEIERIEEEIERLLKLREKHNFKYSLRFQQGF